MKAPASTPAADYYAARVDAVVAQRTRLRGPQPARDLFAGLPPDHPLLTADPRRALDANLAALAEYIEPKDVIIDVGGGAGRMSLPLALRCREVINVDASDAMGASFVANAARAGIENARFVAGDWLAVDPPVGAVALVNHVTYLTRDIEAFIRKLEVAGPRRVMVTVSTPPPPAWARLIYGLVYGEPEEIVPGHVELAQVLWELGRRPEIRVLPVTLSVSAGASLPHTREAAIAAEVTRFRAEQWGIWPLGDELERRVREALESRFAELFAEVDGAYVPTWLPPRHEILLTWQPPRDH